MTKLFTVAEMMGRDLARRRVALALLAFVPLLFYIARHDANPEKAIRFAGLGLAWAVSTAGLFLSNTTKAVERRLRQIGYRPAHLYLGTLTALLTLGAVLAAVYWVLIYVDQDTLQRPGAVAIEFGLTIVIAAPLGLLISAVAPHDLEGTLVLISITGLQFLVDPEQKLGKALPFWSDSAGGALRPRRWRPGIPAQGPAARCPVLRRPHAGHGGAGGCAATAAQAHADQGGHAVGATLRAWRTTPAANSRHLVQRERHVVGRCHQQREPIRAAARLPAALLQLGHPPHTLVPGG